MIDHPVELMGHGKTVAEWRTEGEVPQVVGCLPQGYGLDSMLTIPQLARWQRMSLRRAGDLARAGLIRGVAPDRRPVQVHVRTFLAGLGAEFREGVRTR